MDKELQGKVKVVTSLMHEIVKEIEAEILHNLEFCDTTADNYLLTRLNKKYREMKNKMEDYENTLVAQLKNINFVIDFEAERAKLEV